MKFSIFKKKPAEVAGMMFALVVGFIDHLRLPGSGSQPLSLAETYLLAEWLQVASLISAGGGFTNRVQEILKNFAGTQFERTLAFFVQTKKLKESDVASFRDYLLEVTTQRRELYDNALQQRGSMRDVAVVAIPHLVVGDLSLENSNLATDALKIVMEQIVLDSITRLKELI